MIDIAVATTAFSVANALGASPKVMLSLFEAGLVESGFRNLPHQGAANDHDSIGYLQQRPSMGWPDPMNVEIATRSYVTRAKQNEARNPGYTAGQLAQSVQRSAYPDRYDKREQEAKDLLSRVSGGTGPAAPGPAARPALDVTPGNIADAMASIADTLRTMATGVVNIGGLAGTFAKLALPTNVTRVICGGLGIVFIFMGIVIIGREV